MSMATFDLETTTADVLARMLRRLPPSLWDNSPFANTLQRDLYRAIAEQCARWLAQRQIARSMSLLLQAEGRDLDTLLQDYGLKRYLNRADDYARQIGMHCLWMSKGTEFSIANMADLLFDPIAHVTLRTGRNHLHVFLANTQDVTTPYTYWGLVSQQGLWYAVTVDGLVPVLSQRPPPGLDVSPGPQTLHWFTALDASSALWYVTIDADTLILSQTQPPGTGTLEPFSVLDGHGTQWTLSVDAASEVLVTTGVPAPSDAQIVLSPHAQHSAIQLRDAAAVSWWLSVDAGTFTLTTTLPSGATDVTPAGGPFRWLRFYDRAGGVWYAFPSTAGVLIVDSASPGSPGTLTPRTMGDALGVLWHWGVTDEGTAALSSAPPVDYGGMATALCLTDEAGARWFWRVHGQVLEWSAVRWPDTLDQSPWGDLGWLKTTNEDGEVRYLFPSPLGDPMAGEGPPSASPWGWPEAPTLRDHRGINWQFDVLRDNRVGIVPLISDDIPPAETPLDLREAQDAFGHVQAAGSLVTVLMT